MSTSTCAHGREYGALTNQSVDAMEAAEDADPRGKRNPQDFALWKGAKADEQADATWASPWGPGRPGWHIECSAMSKRYLGAEFDIHGGGLDLRFPHHENELAQSTAAGDGFARYWVHNGLVTVNGQKMSKSLGNFTLAADVLAEHDPLVVRYALAAAHYRSSLDLTESSWDEAEAALGRIRHVHRPCAALAHRMRRTARIGEMPDAFAAAMDDDLGVPQALAVVHETVRAGQRGARRRRRPTQRRRVRPRCTRCSAVLGFDGSSAGRGRRCAEHPLSTHSCRR